MIFGDSVVLRKKHSKIECGYSHSIKLCKIVLIHLERLNLAVNAAIVSEAAAARLVLAGQALAECRQQNNPYLPGNSPLGPSRAQMYGPDPCMEQEKELAEAQAAQAAAQISNAPTQQNLGSAPHVQLADTWDSSELYQPDTINADLPELESVYSPMRVQEVVHEILQKLGEEPTDEELMELEILEENMRAVSLWIPLPLRQTKKRYQLKLRNPGWVGKWVPQK